MCCINGSRGRTRLKDVVLYEVSETVTGLDLNLRGL